MDAKQVEKAAGALQKWAKDADKAKATATVDDSALSLFAVGPAATAAGGERAVSLEVNFLQAPVPNRVPLFVDTPHPLRKEPSVCVVVPEPQSKYQELLLEADAAHCVKKVVDTVKLAGQFRDPVALCALAKSFDLFLVHGGLTEYPKELTGQFLKWQTPVWMTGGKKTKDFAAEIDKSLSRAVVPRRGFNDVSIVIGHTGQSAKQLVANAETVFGKVAAAEGAVLAARLAVAVPSGKRLALPVYAAPLFDGKADGPAKKKGRKE